MDSGLVFGDRAPRQHRGEWTLQLGSNTCAAIIVVVNMYLTCSCGKYFWHH